MDMEAAMHPATAMGAGTEPDTEPDTELDTGMELGMGTPPL